MRKGAFSLIVAGLFLIYPLAAEAYEVTAVKDGGTLKGSVVFKGTPPPPKKLIIGKDPEFCGKDPVTGKKQLTRDSKELIVKNGRIANVVVYLEDIKRGKAWKVPAGGFVLDQKNCDFRPRVQVVAPGELTVVNSDPVLHNSHAFEGTERGRGRTVFNFAQPIQGQKNTARLRRPGIHEVKCDAHGWMHAWLYVSEHPYADVTGEDGTFSISDVPPGTYKVVAWHEVLGTQEKEITVKEKGVVNVTFEFAR